MASFIAKYLPNVAADPQSFVTATGQTLYMTLWTSLVAGIIGLLVGVLLVVTRPGGLYQNKPFFQVLDKVVNIVRAIPFIILLALLATVTQHIVGTTIGSKAALVPLVVCVIPFYGRQIETALLEVDPGVVEAAQAMGISRMGIIFRVYLREGLISIVRVSALTIISLISLTAMAGAVGGGGLGDLAISQGYNRFENDITVVATLLILLLVLISQLICNLIIKKLSH
ncbi:MAG: ABC transporter permease [[Lactobacillus] timonensis]|jgi:D-methionine transport system permease protein|uniref:methionine ABC transporter permease n=1 Tax=[Lactobacillus] timonensis TaxID=1970790 RepID=UPI000C83F5C6|nr:methionine ABC transporter permease [[Lactobacillus] timonensis]MCI1926396.1 ABC transporter permease [[Lactobacillus] timonensis]MCI1957765.1 ABC transporter permease [[Lactobacillus] timonensis]MCI1970775.1 ABC transporter permease [[Lactobacillus] timonensis]MCI2006921.1 ABC transporter permease [[Lactobacillus] timonensis]